MVKGVSSRRDRRSSGRLLCATSQPRETRRRWMSSTAMLGVFALWAAVHPAFAQERPNLDFVPLLNGQADVNPTGIRGITITGSESLPDGDTGGYIYDADKHSWIPFPQATSSGV